MAEPNDFCEYIKKLELKIEDLEKEVKNSKTLQAGARRLSELDRTVHFTPPFALRPIVVATALSRTDTNVTITITRREPGYFQYQISGSPADPENGEEPLVLWIATLG